MHNSSMYYPISDMIWCFLYTSWIFWMMCPHVPDGLTSKTSTHLSGSVLIVITICTISCWKYKENPVSPWLFDGSRENILQACEFSVIRSKPKNTVSLILPLHLWLLHLHYTALQSTILYYHPGAILGLTFTALRGKKCRQSDTRAARWHITNGSRLA